MIQSYHTLIRSFLFDSYLVGGLLKSTKKEKSCKSQDLQDSVRRERDSNPRYLSVRRFSRPVHSTTLPSLQFSRMTIAWFLKASAKVMLYIELRKYFGKKVS